MMHMRAIARGAIGFAVATSLIASALGPSAIALADELTRDHRGSSGTVVHEPSPPDPGAPPPIVRDHRFPAARLQLVVNQVHIYNDRDGFGAGDGEMKLFSGLYQLDDQHVFMTPSVASAVKGFSAGSGDDVTLEQIVPSDGDTMRTDASAQTGISVFAGRQYLAILGMLEYDTLTLADDMGDVRIEVNEANGWGVGTGVLRSSHSNGKPGDFDVTYEIRRTPLPDLQPTAFRVLEDDPRPGADNRACITVQNRGPVASEAYRMSIAIDAASPPATTTGDSGLAAGESRELCTSLRLPESGSHQVTLEIDPERAIPEMDENNNVLQQTLIRTSATQPSPTPAPSPMPVTADRQVGTAQADLTVTAVKVNGQVPDGKDDCQGNTSKNAVAVTVKNAGAGKAGSFVVQLAVDGANSDAAEQTVKGLDAGQEREIRFDSITLKKGEHKLTATADSKAAVAESQEENNDRAVTVACKADS